MKAKLLWLLKEGLTFLGFVFLLRASRLHLEEAYQLSLSTSWGLSILLIFFLYTPQDGPDDATHQS